ncbi:MAG TPA: hypothetical protein VN578_06895 [Candidatus Binatia bacterium]|jgi:hypothetical protein|nr:hypothetical protein [Candidatus Binatia bacterium]
MDTTKIINGAESDPAQVTAPLPLTPQALSQTIQLSSSAPFKAASGGGELIGAQGVSGPELGTTSEAGGDDKPPLEQPQWEKKKRGANPRDEKHNWLMTDPQEWVGRKVRSRRNFSVYSVSQVYKTGRVRLERNWMSYLTDAETVRTQYDPYW